MQKYLLNFSFLIILMGCFAFLLSSPLDQKTLAQFPTFEIYPSGGKSYPSVEDFDLQLSGTTLSVTAKITDPSGVYVSLLTIKNGSGESVGAVSMLHIGNDIYKKIFIANFPYGTYYVNLSVRDGLSHYYIYENIGDFTLGEVVQNCQDSGEARLCISTSLETPEASNPTTMPCQTSGDATLCISRSFY